MAEIEKGVVLEESALDDKDFHVKVLENGTIMKTSKGCFKPVDILIDHEVVEFESNASVKVSLGTATQGDKLDYIIELLERLVK